MTDQKNTSRETICFLTSALVMGGVERVLIDTTHLLKDEFDIVVVSVYGKPDEDVVAQFPKEVKVICLGMAAKNAFLLFPYMSRFHYEKALKKLNYDYLVVVNGAVMNAGYVRKAKHTIFWQHNDVIEKYTDQTLPLPQRLKRFFFKRLYKKYNQVWTVCDKIKDDYIRAFGLQHVKTLPNPVDCERGLVQSGEICDVCFDKKTKNVIMVGRLSEEKGFDRVIRALFEDECNRERDVHVYIIGDGPCYTQYKKMIEDYGVVSKVSLLGKKQNPYPYIKQADVLVCPSYSESFGLVIMEAMLMKVPVITTATSGGVYTTQNGQYAICIENEKELRTELIGILDGSKKYSRSLQDAFDWVLQHDKIHYKETICRFLKENH